MFVDEARYFLLFVSMYYNCLLLLAKIICSYSFQVFIESSEILVAILKDLSFWTVTVEVYLISLGDIIFVIFWLLLAFLI